MQRDLIISVLCSEQQRATWCVIKVKNAGAPSLSQTGTRELGGGRICRTD